MEKISSLILVLSTVTKVLPSSLGTAYEKVLTWLRQVDNIETAEKDWIPKVADIIKTRSNSKDYVWKVCGIAASSSTPSSSHGYTCGLWLLMHYLTVSSEIKNVSAIEVMNAIR